VELTIALSKNSAVSTDLSSSRYPTASQVPWRRRPSPSLATPKLSQAACRLDGFGELATVPW